MPVINEEFKIGRNVPKILSEPTFKGESKHNSYKKKTIEKEVAICVTILHIIPTISSLFLHHSLLIKMISGIDISSISVHNL